MAAAVCKYPICMGWSSCEQGCLTRRANGQSDLGRLAAFLGGEEGKHARARRGHC